MDVTPVVLASLELGGTRSGDGGHVENHCDDGLEHFSPTVDRDDTNGDESANRHNTDEK